LYTVMALVIVALNCVRLLAFVIDILDCL